jgi:hypothetical protein
MYEQQEYQNEGDNHIDSRTQKEYEQPSTASAGNLFNKRSYFTVSMLGKLTLVLTSFRDKYS